MSNLNLVLVILFTRNVYFGRTEDSCFSLLWLSSINATASEENVDITPEYHTRNNKLKKHWNHDEMESELAIQEHERHLKNQTMVYRFLTFGKMSPLVELSEKRFFPLTTLPFAVANIAQGKGGQILLPFLVAKTRFKKYRKKQEMGGTVLI